MEVLNEENHRVHMRKTVLEDTLAVLIADVSGKGVPAALFMVIAKTLIVNIANYAYNPIIGDAIIRIAVSGEISIEFEDEGKPYNPLEKDDPAEDRAVTRYSFHKLSIPIKAHILPIS